MSESAINVPVRDEQPSGGRSIVQRLLQIDEIGVIGALVVSHPIASAQRGSLRMCNGNCSGSVDFPVVDSVVIPIAVRTPVKTLPPAAVQIESNSAVRSASRRTRTSAPCGAGA